MSAGKGDRLRQVKGDAFREGWERVFGKDAGKPGDCRRPVLCLLDESAVPCAICPNAKDEPTATL